MKDNIVIGHYSYMLDELQDLNIGVVGASPVVIVYFCRSIKSSSLA